ncbi:putative non-specific serine/threonine protein kinase [Lupinus albus]|uniref:Putative non-specific serine/threonine protein kinase n=1 Tax=Lupinus albus TaxID=3870 RepID=A0A6A4R7A0_LUPAL|nr:putative non-specific serine/threonine protein kinase [Lupinus albus]
MKSSHQRVHALIFHIIFISLLPLKITEASTRREAEAEAEALVKWKNSLSQPLPYSLTSWSFNNIVNLCNWGGIVCDYANTTVSEINLRDSKLNGTISGLYFGSLLNLTSLNLNGNNLGGSISSTIHL